MRGLTTLCQRSVSMVGESSKTSNFFPPAIAPVTSADVSGYGQPFEDAVKTFGAIQRGAVLPAQTYTAQLPQSQPTIVPLPPPPLDGERQRYVAGMQTQVSDLREGLQIDSGLFGSTNWLAGPDKKVANTLLTQVEFYLDIMRAPLLNEAEFTHLSSQAESVLSRAKNEVARVKWLYEPASAPGAVEVKTDARSSMSPVFPHGEIRAPDAGDPGVITVPLHNGLLKRAEQAGLAVMPATDERAAAVVLRNDASGAERLFDLHSQDYGLGFRLPVLPKGARREASGAFMHRFNLLNTLQTGSAWREFFSDPNVALGATRSGAVRPAAMQAHSLGGRGAAGRADVRPPDRAPVAEGRGPTVKLGLSQWLVRMDLAHVAKQPSSGDADAANAIKPTDNIRSPDRPASTADTDAIVRGQLADNTDLNALINYSRQLLRDPDYWQQLPALPDGQLANMATSPPDALPSRGELLARLRAGAPELADDITQSTGTARSLLQPQLIFAMNSDLMEGGSVLFPAMADLAAEYPDVPQKILAEHFADFLLNNQLSENAQLDLSDLNTWFKRYKTSPPQADAAGESSTRGDHLAQLAKEAPEIHHTIISSASMPANRTVLSVALTTAGSAGHEQLSQLRDGLKVDYPHLPDHEVTAAIVNFIGDGQLPLSATLPDLSKLNEHYRQIDVARTSKQAAELRALADSDSPAVLKLVVSNHATSTDTLRYLSLYSPFEDIRTAALQALTLRPEPASNPAWDLIQNLLQRFNQ